MTSPPDGPATSRTPNPPMGDGIDDRTGGDAHAAPGTSGGIVRVYRASSAEFGDPFLYSFFVVAHEGVTHVKGMRSEGAFKLSHLASIAGTLARARASARWRGSATAAGGAARPGWRSSRTARIASSPSRESPDGRPRGRARMPRPVHLRRRAGGGRALHPMRAAWGVARPTTISPALPPWSERQ
jgi:hypothetical protein